ncbi:MAG: PepSY domain-containing protein [Hyphomicrobiaceae bacterium]|nr:PepSY domain-containing protein [Hyphomicrobiaceae bacterium]
MFLVAGPAFASSDDGRRGRGRDDSGHHERYHDRDGRRVVDRTGWLSEAEITKKLAAAGLKVQHIKAEYRKYEVYAIDEKGVRVKLDVNPTSGEVFRRRHKR